ncbi:MAG: hypothetical protein WBD20_00390 [Pirellulaceae bacterium]
MQMASLVATLTATVTATVVASTASAGGLEPLQRIGRTLGCGWGDGYHACQDSGFRPGADLPPRSYSKQFGGGCLPGSPCAGSWSPAGPGSYYDQFDAQFRGRSVGCGGVGCDNPGCDAPGCDSARKGNVDYSRSQTYVVGGPGHASSQCDSPGNWGSGNCDASNGGPGCDGQSCDSANFASTWVPTVNQPPADIPANQIAAPSTPPAYSQSESYNAQPADASISPTPTIPDAVVTPEPASNSDVDTAPSPSDSRELKLPELGFSENESNGELAGEEAAEILPAPVDQSIESAPMPTPDPNTDLEPSEQSEPQGSVNPPLPDVLGPLDASASPGNGHRKGFPAGWTEKPATANPFVQPQEVQSHGAKPVSLPAQLDTDLLDTELHFPVDNPDDLLLFESANLSNPRSRSPQVLGAASNRNAIRMPNLPVALPGKPASFGAQPARLPATSPPQRPEKLGRSVSPSQFITQPD